MIKNYLLKEEQRQILSLLLVLSFLDVIPTPLLTYAFSRKLFRLYKIKYIFGHLKATLSLVKCPWFALRVPEFIIRQYNPLYCDIYFLTLRLSSFLQIIVIICHNPLNDLNIEIF